MGTGNIGLLFGLWKGHGNKLINFKGTISFISGNKGQVPPHPERAVLELGVRCLSRKTLVRVRGPC